MRRIQHFFVRGNNTIKLAASTIFLNSSINEVVFEEIEFSAPPDCFAGLVATTVQLVNSNWKSCSNTGKFYNFPQKIDHFSINKSTLEHLVVEAYYNVTYFHIMHSTICDVISSGNDHILYPVPITSVPQVHNDSAMEAERPADQRSQNIKIVETVIKTIATNAFKNIKKIEKLEIYHCRITAIEEYAFQSAEINQIQIHRTHIDKLFPRAFAISLVDLFLWKECDIGAIGAKVFFGTNIRILRFIRCRITTLAKNGFSELEANYFLLEKMKIYKCEESLFSGSTVSFFTLL